MNIISLWLGPYAKFSIFTVTIKKKSELKKKDFSIIIVKFMQDFIY